MLHIAYSLHTNCTDFACEDYNVSYGTGLQCFIRHEQLTYRILLISYVLLMTTYTLHTQLTTYICIICAAYNFQMIYTHYLQLTYDLHMVHIMCIRYSQSTYDLHRAIGYIWYTIYIWFTYLQSKHDLEMVLTIYIWFTYATYNLHMVYKYCLQYMH